MMLLIRNTLVPFIAFLVCFSLNSAAQESTDGASKQKNSEGKTTSNYKVSASLIGASGDIYYLIKDGTQWKVSKTGDITQSGVEKILINFQTKTIYLGALPPKTVSDSERQRGAGKDNIWECYSGLLSGTKRDAAGYIICASDFTKNVTTAGQALVGSLNLLLGTARTMVSVDQEKLLAVAQSSGLIDLADHDFAERERVKNEVETARLAADDAASHGDAQAKYARGLAYLHGTGMQRDSKIAEDWFIQMAPSATARQSLRSIPARQGPGPALT